MGCGPAAPEEWQGGGEGRGLMKDRRERKERAVWSEAVGVLVKEGSSTES